MDFTIKNYNSLLVLMLENGLSFFTFSESLKLQSKQCIVLRHDVDLLPQNSLKFAKIQHQLGIKGSYYFRVVPESWDENIIKQIAELGHEVGYHYETMDEAANELKVKSDALSVSKGRKLKVKEYSDVRLNEFKDKCLRFDYKKVSEFEDELIDLAFEKFCFHLENLRKLVPVSTICMHGSPRSKFDNKDIWKKYDYRKLDILGEPYFDVDFDKMFYITDTGRMWDGYKVSIRDKVSQQERWIKEGLTFHSTDQIIQSIQSGKFPKNTMMTFHPQRWDNPSFLWVKELVLQSIKNLVKYGVIHLSNKRRFKNI